MDTAIGCLLGKMVFKTIHRKIGADVIGLKNTLAFACLDGNGAVVALAG